MQKIPVEDRLDIQELVARYAFFCDTKGYRHIDALFAEDGIFDESILGMPVVQGRAAIRELFSQTGSTVDFLIHLNCNHQLSEFDGSTARGTAHLHAEGSLNGGHAFRILGYYADDYVKSAGQWLLKHRKLVAIAPLQGFDAP